MASQSNLGSNLNPNLIEERKNEPARPRTRTLNANGIQADGSTGGGPALAVESMSERSTAQRQNQRVNRSAGRQ